MSNKKDEAWARRIIADVPMTCTMLLVFPVVISGSYFLFPDNFKPLAEPFVYGSLAVCVYGGFVELVHTIQAKRILRNAPTQEQSQ